MIYILYIETFNNYFVAATAIIKVIERTKRIFTSLGVSKLRGILLKTEN